MVLVLGGGFRFGAKPKEDGLGGAAIEGEWNVVPAFYLDEREVSNAQFAAFVDATGHRTVVESRGEGTVFVPLDPGMPTSVAGANWRRPTFDVLAPRDWASLPVVLISWDDAVAFAEWVACSLPTEVEFEYAIRDGREGELYPWGTDLPPVKVVGNIPDASIRRTWPVPVGRTSTWYMPAYDDGHAGPAPCGTFPSNHYGVFDLEGNVMEWCEDPDPKAQEGRAARGGSWRSSGAEWLRASETHYAPRSAASDELGFRCARRVSALR
jgi:formylglycine-generating enzyme required for sulfatase activity